MSGPWPAPSHAPPTHTTPQWNISSEKKCVLFSAPGLPTGSPSNASTSCPSGYSPLCVVSCVCVPWANTSGGGGGSLPAGSNATSLTTTTTTTISTRQARLGPTCDDTVTCFFVNKLPYALAILGVCMLLVLMVAYCCKRCFCPQAPCVPACITRLLCCCCRGKAGRATPQKIVVRSSPTGGGKKRRARSRARSALARAAHGIEHSDDGDDGRRGAPKARRLDSASRNQEGREDGGGGRLRAASVGRVGSSSSKANARRPPSRQYVDPRDSRRSSDLLAVTRSRDLLRATATNGNRRDLLAQSRDLLGITRSQDPLSASTLEREWERGGRDMGVHPFSAWRPNPLRGRLGGGRAAASPEETLPSRGRMSPSRSREASWEPPPRRSRSQFRSRSRQQSTPRRGSLPQEVDSARNDFLQQPFPQETPRRPNPSGSVLRSSRSRSLSPQPSSARRQWSPR